VNLPRLDVGPTLRERAYETILEAVQSFTLVPGECYSIWELTGRLGVSRTPLRDVTVVGQGPVVRDPVTFAF